MIDLLKSLVQKGERGFRQVVLRSSPVLWANLGTFSQLLAKSIPTLSPPILVISLPRSGSSWVGNILGLSRTSLYLREPITTTYMRARKKGPSFFEVNKDNLPSTYRNAAQKAFRGLPTFSKAVVKNPRSWSIHRRIKKRIVVKEVNPLAIQWLLESYDPRVIYLIRHPAAVANSFYKLGWTDPQFEPRFSKKALDTMNIEYKKFEKSFWMEHGLLQSVIQQLTLAVLQNEKNYNYRVVKYEDLCNNPVKHYQELYKFAGFDWEPGIERNIVANSTSVQQHVTGQHGVQRDSQAMIDKWQFEIPTEEIRKLQEAYLSLNPPFYNEEENW